MRCPYCSNPAFEQQADCSRCGFSLRNLDSIFGAVPPMSPGVSDQATLLTPRERRKLAAEVDGFRRRFPQLNMHVVTTRVSPGANLSAYAFWIFNKAGICSDLERGGKNRDILLMIDETGARACLIVGYGLEPFVGEHHLAEAVGAGTEAFRENEFFKGILAVMATLSDILAQISDSIDRTYGISTSDMRLAESPRGESGERPFIDDSSPY